jgi:small-conductance mechanosensitive channel
MEGVLHWVALAFLGAALLLSKLVPAERLRIRTALLLFASFVVAVATAGVITFSGAGPDHFAYRTARWAALLLFGIAVVNLVSILLFDVLLKALRVHPPRILRDLLLAISYIAIALVLLSRNGFDLTGIVATSAVITAVIGFSLADTLGNIMGGMALQMEHTIEIGDWINVDGMEGKVKEIRWRQTSIETRNWDTIVIPNSVLMKMRVSLLGHRDGAPRQQRRWVYFNVDFRFAPTAVIEAVETALRAEPIPNVASTPEPHCLLTEFKGQLCNVCGALLAHRSRGQRPHRLRRSHADILRAPARGNCAVDSCAVDFSHRGDGVAPRAKGDRRTRAAHGGIGTRRPFREADAR